MMEHIVDFVKHLRLLHFSLVSICIIFLLTAGIKKPYITENAYKQATEIRSFSKDFYTQVDKAPYPSITNQIVTQYKKYPFYFSDEKNTFSVYKSPAVIRYEDMKTYYPESYNSYKVGSGMRSWESFDESPESIIGNLNKFKATWDDLQSIKNVFVISNIDIENIEYTVREIDNIKIIKGKPPEKTIDLGDNNIELIKNKDKSGWEIKYRFEKHINNPFLSISIPVKLKLITSDYQKQIVKKLDLNWPSGKFEESFSDLSFSSKGKESLTLRQLENQLQKEASGNEQEVQLFGASVPLSLIRVWGPLFLLILQVYLMLHIQNFTRNINNTQEAFKVPWVVMYRDVGSRLVSLISIAILPTISGLVVATGDSNSIVNMPEKNIYWLSLFLQLIVGIYSYKLVHYYLMNNANNTANN